MHLDYDNVYSILTIYTNYLDARKVENGCDAVLFQIRDG